MLYQHQQLFIDKSPNKYMLAWEMRLGKTLAAILWAKKRGKCLIICPKFLTAQWIEECKKYDLWCDVYSKEQFRIHHKELGKYDSIICDECHLFGNPTSQLSKALAFFIRDIPNVLLLTGTPYTSSNWCVWQYGRYLGRWNKDTYINFRNKFFNLVHFGPRAIWQNKEDKVTRETLSKLIKSFGETLTTEEVFDLPQHTTEVVHFAETKEQTKAKLLNEDIHPLARFTALHQIEASKSEKDDWLIDLCEKEPKVIVICRYTSQIERLKAILPHSLVLNGETKDKKVVIDGADMAFNCVLLVQATVAEGYGLPSFPVMVYASLDWSYIKYIQMFARNKGPKQLKPTTTYVLLTKKGVDEDVWDCLKDKHDFTSEIMKND
jgi:superfamily II DNA or RNA helicase